jgi:ribosomal protein S18 acetylase RimI-like enzyme
VPGQFTLGPVGEDDIDAVMRVQALCYPASMQEPRTIVLSRIRAAGDMSLVARGDAGVCAYAFAYGSMLGAVTELDAEFEPAPQPDTLYLHDLAVAPAALGKGLARAMTGRLLDIARARRLAHSALVSVQDSERFWSGLGYAAYDKLDAHALAALRTYPGAARYMARRLGAPVAGEWVHPCKKAAGQEHPTARSI